ncbi:MAG: ABC transporter substrate-binding protein [Candidatus Altiarchaeota archaeon]
MHNKILPGIVILTIILATVFIGDGITGRAIFSPNPTQGAITIGLPLGAINGLLMVARDKGYFEEEGLVVEFVEFTAGKFALQAFLSNSLDLTASGEVPVMYSAYQGNEFYVITQLVNRTIGNIVVVARRDGNLEDPEGYFNNKKRKLATSFGGGPEFYTYNFLKKYNIKDVELVEVKPGDMPAALASGSVDAVAIFEPFATFSENALADEAIVFSDEALYSEYFVLDAHKEWVEKNPKQIEKILKALVRASDYVDQHPEESKEIIMKYTKLDKETLDRIWDSVEFDVALNKELLNTLEEEAQWAKETGKVQKNQPKPNLQGYLYKDGLLKVKPEVVSL